jgi:hypothetical protein
MYDGLRSPYILLQSCKTGGWYEKNYIKLQFHVPYMTQIMAPNPLMPELNSWCEVQETGVQMKAAQGGHEMTIIYTMHFEF